MHFGHEQLDVYRVSIQYVAFDYATANRLAGNDRHARDQLLQASQSILLNIAEGNGKGTNADRRRFFEIARGSALECSAIQDCLEACGVMTAAENADGRAMLIRIVSMLTKLGQRSLDLGEGRAVYGGFDSGFGSDYDYDNDAERRRIDSSS